MEKRVLHAILAAQKISTIPTVSMQNSRLVSPIQWSAECEMRSDSSILLQ